MNDYTQSSVDLLEATKAELYTRLVNKRDDAKTVERLSKVLVEATDTQNKLLQAEEETKNRDYELYLAERRDKKETRLSWAKAIGGFILGLIGIVRPLRVGSYYHEKDMEWEESQDHVLGPARTTRKNVQNLLRFK